VMAAMDLEASGCILPKQMNIKDEEDDWRS
jgi:hypothetical protein